MYKGFAVFSNELNTGVLIRVCTNPRDPAVCAAITNMLVLCHCTGQTEHKKRRLVLRSDVVGDPDDVWSAAFRRTDQRTGGREL